MKRLLLALMVLGIVPALAAATGPLSVESPFQPAKPLSVTDVPIPFSCAVHGVVVLEAPLSETRELQRLEVRRDSPCLTPLAVQAIQEWKFSPATYEGEAIAARMPVIVTFRPPAAIVTPVTLPELRRRSEAAVQAEFQPAEVMHAAFPNYPYNTVVWGTVVLEVTLGAKGETEEVQVLRDLTPLTAEAKAVLEQWRFMPATFNGHPVRSQIVLAFVFSPIYTPSPSRRRR